MIHSCWYRLSAISLLLATCAAAESTGQLHERALQFHEACFEARISLDPASYEREWANLVRYLRSSSKGKAGVTVSGNSSDWSLQLMPLNGPVWVSATPRGVWLQTKNRQESTPIKDLLSVYPLRRHYTCDGRALTPATPGIPSHPVPCAPPPRSQATLIKIEAASEKGAILFALPRIECCYQVVSAEEVLEPGQILVNPSGRGYQLHPLPDQKWRLLYGENTSLFVMDRKEPKLYLIDLR
jgi:hypothetical protein